MAKVNRMVITINPILLGNFKNRTLIYPKKADKAIRIVMIKK